MAVWVIVLAVLAFAAGAASAVFTGARADVRAARAKLRAARRARYTAGKTSVSRWLMLAVGVAVFAAWIAGSDGR
jgi:hypothetical protein